jgi:16S rRNA (guanine527-N7)-methyltransferase
VISRKDMENFYLHHVLHSLAISQIVQFQSSTRILDIGTGGGFPGIPLAILFPDSHFHLVDSIGKKIKVVQGVVDSLGLKNVKTQQIRAEELGGQYDFIVSRAVTSLNNFMPWVKGKVSGNSFNDIPNGILYLKGGDLTEELENVKQLYIEYDITEFFEEEFFETKKVVYIDMITKMS